MRDYKIAVVEFLGVNDEPTGSKYYFRLYDKLVNTGDYVLCDTDNGLRIAIVDYITSEEEYYTIGDYVINKQVICKINPFQWFNRRDAIRNYRRVRND